MKILKPTEQNPAGARPGLHSIPGAHHNNRTADQAAKLLEAHERLHGAIGDLSKALDTMAPKVIALQTVALDSSGTASLQFRVPFQCVTVDSQSAAKLTVAAAPLQGAAPGTGPGVAIVRAGGFAVCNMRAYQLSIYGGTVGELVTVTAYANPQPPFVK